MMKMKNQELIKKWEALKLEAYLPTPNDVWTIGWGHTHTTKRGMKITKAEAQALFDRDIAWAERAVNTKVKVPLTQNQFDALVSFVFNVGETAFANSTMLRKLNAGDYQGAANEFPRWNKQKGQVLRGLVRRRAEEMEIFLSAAPVVNTSVTVDEEKPLKPIWQSTEVIAGGGAAITAVAGLAPEAQTLLTQGLIALVVAAGLYIIVNRLVARRKGER